MINKLKNLEELLENREEILYFFCIIVNRWFYGNSSMYRIILPKISQEFNLEYFESTLIKLIDDVVDLLSKYNRLMLNSVRWELMAIYGISERHYMNGKDINHVYRILHNMKIKKKYASEDRSFVYEKPSYES